MNLHGYYRSSATYRVRIALNLKNIDYTTVPVHLLRNGGEHRKAAYVSLNPQALVPTLQDDSLTVGQSLAILEYLEETHPEPPLLPQDPAGRAVVRAVALTVACEIHPLNNLRVLRYLKDELRVDESRKMTWYHHWVRAGFTAIERLLGGAQHGSPYCHGEAPTLADCCLIPQVYNALRFDAPVAEYPTIMRIYDKCLALEAFRRAAPENQPDRE